MTGDNEAGTGMQAQTRLITLVARAGSDLSSPEKCRTFMSPPESASQPCVMRIQHLGTSSSSRGSRHRHWRRGTPGLAGSAWPIRMWHAGRSAPAWRTRAARRAGQSEAVETHTTLMAASFEWLDRYQTPCSEQMVMLFTGKACCIQGERKGGSAVEGRGDSLR